MLLYPIIVSHLHFNFLCLLLLYSIHLCDTQPLSQSNCTVCTVTFQFQSSQEIQYKSTTACSINLCMVTSQIGQQGSTCHLWPETSRWLFSNSITLLLNPIVMALLSQLWCTSYPIRFCLFKYCKGTIEEEC
jgi:hypothetical protein